MMMYWVVNAFFSGALVPLSFFPPWLRDGGRAAALPDPGVPAASRSTSASWRARRRCARSACRLFWVVAAGRDRPARLAAGDAPRRRAGRLR